MDSIKVANLLNTTGVLLQQRIHTMLSRGPYRTKYEYPYTLGDISGRADVIAVGESDEKAVFFSIEVKKAAKEKKHWIFFRQEEKQSALFPYWCEEPFVQVSPQQQVFIPTWFPRLGNLRRDDLTLYDTVFEVNETWTSVFRGERRDAAEKAMSQANTALTACYRDYPTVSAAFGNVRKRYAIFIPVVVTSANLYEAKFDPKDVDIETGEIDVKKLQCTPKEWVAYNFALPGYLREHLFVLEGFDENNKPRFAAATTLEKNITFAVNSSYFGKFVEDITKEIYPK